MSLPEIGPFFAQISPFLLPPFIGAIIGYVTNRIAISMLFRPYREKRLFGIRIPFTPGIIPRQRFKLSASIGTMVSRHLLTKEAVEKQLRAPEFHERIFTYVDKGIESFLSTPVEQQLKALKLLNIRGKDEEQKAQPLVAPFFQGVSRAFLDYYWNRPFHELFPEGFLTNSLLSLAERISREDKKLGEILTHKGIDHLATILESRYKDIVKGIDGFLQKPLIKKQLELRGRLFLDDVLSRLNSMQRFMLMAGQYDRALVEKMPSIVEDARIQLYRGLQDEAIRKKVVQWFKVVLHRVRKERVSALFQKVSGGGIAPEGGFTNFLQELGSSFAGIPLSRIASWFGFKDPQDASTTLSQLLFERGKRSRKGGVISSLLTTAPKELIILTEESRRELTGGITDAVLLLLDKNIDPILENVDVHTLVVNRIDELEVERVEELLLVVIKTHLKYINLFGALLGAMIGALQIFL